MHMPTVLVVEADPAIRKLFDDVLRLEGYQVELIEPSGLSAARVAAAQPNLLLLELTAHNTSAVLALMGELQRLPATAGLPILVSTTLPLLLERHRAALRRFGSGTLLKPFDLDDLLDTIGRQVLIEV